MNQVEENVDLIMMQQKNNEQIEEEGAISNQEQNNEHNNNNNNNNEGEEQNQQKGPNDREWPTPYSIFVGNLNSDLKEEDFESMFSGLGEIVKCKLIKAQKSGNTFGFIGFQSEEDVEKALQLFEDNYKGKEEFDKLKVQQARVIVRAPRRRYNNNNNNINRRRGGKFDNVEGGSMEERNESNINDEDPDASRESGAQQERRMNNNRRRRNNGNVRMNEMYDNSNYGMMNEENMNNNNNNNNNVRNGFFRRRNNYYYQRRGNSNYGARFVDYNKFPPHFNNQGNNMIPEMIEQQYSGNYNRLNRNQQFETEMENDESIRHVFRARINPYDQQPQQQFYNNNNINNNRYNNRRFNNNRVFYNNNNNNIPNQEFENGPHNMNNNNILNYHGNGSFDPNNNFNENRRFRKQNPQGSRNSRSFRSSYNNNSGGPNNYGADFPLSETDLFVANLPYSITQEELNELFKQFNPSKCIIKLPNSKKSNRPTGCAFVSFSNQEDQKLALSSMNNKKVNDRFIIVRVAYIIPSSSSASSSTTAPSIQSTNPTEDQANFEAFSNVANNSETATEAS